MSFESTWIAFFSLSPKEVDVRITKLADLYGVICVRVRGPGAKLDRRIFLKNFRGRNGETDIVVFGFVVVVEGGIVRIFSCACVSVCVITRTLPRLIKGQASGRGRAASSFVTHSPLPISRLSGTATTSGSKEH